MRKKDAVFFQKKWDTSTASKRKRRVENKIEM
jgi:hypothetical protein